MLSRAERREVGVEGLHGSSDHGAGLLRHAAAQRAHVPGHGRAGLQVDGVVEHDDRLDRGTGQGRGAAGDEDRVDGPDDPGGPVDDDERIDVLPGGTSTLPSTETMTLPVTAAGLGRQGGRGKKGEDDRDRGRDREQASHRCPFRGSGRRQGSGSAAGRSGPCTCSSLSPSTLRPARSAPPSRAPGVLRWASPRPSRRAGGRGSKLSRSVDRSTPPRQGR